jgi:hypothetical protein
VPMPYSVLTVPHFHIITNAYAQQPQILLRGIPTLVNLGVSSPFG